jgi:hypothetical protein
VWEGNAQYARFEYEHHGNGTGMSLMKEEKKNRTLEIFFRAMRGEDLSPAKLSENYGVSRKSITRNINPEFPRYLPYWRRFAINILKTEGFVD